MKEIEPIDEIERGIPLFVKVAGGVVLMMLCGFIGVVFMSWRPSAAELEYAAEEEELQEKQASGEDDHEPLRFVYSIPATTPAMRKPTEQEKGSNRSVVGVVVGDVAHAYVLNSGESKTGFLISRIVDGVPLVLAYNYRKQLARGFTDDTTQSPIDIKIGGWQHSQEMVLLYKDVRYVQHSSKIPLAELAAEVTTLSKWLQTHPDSLVSFEEDKSQQ